jgi:aspartate kinase
MLLAHGFLRKVFEIFETHRTSIDMITTSEVGVSVTIDNNRRLAEIVNDLKKFGTVTVDEDMVIVCVVGDMPYEQVGFQAKIVSALKDIPIRMISYGGSNYNVSILVSQEDKKKTLNALSDAIFNTN